MNSEKNFNPEDLRMEIELKKIKLNLEHGGDFFYPDNQNDLPPEVEFEFLKNIEEFEKAFQQNKRLRVYDFIGKPEFRKCDAIADTEISEALCDILNHLNKNQISLETISTVEDREKYRFITEELFLEYMDDIRIEGFRTSFIYEEFHPNHKYDIEHHSADFFSMFMNLEHEYYEIYTSNNEELRTFLKNFRQCFQSFSFDYFRINELRFDAEKASLKFSVSFSGVMDGSNQTRYFIGDGQMEMVNEDNFWCIQKIKFPD